MNRPALAAWRCLICTATLATVKRGVYDKAICAECEAVLARADQKRCRKCNAVLPLSAFCRNVHTHDGHASQCRPCRLVTCKQWKARVQAFWPEYIRRYRINRKYKRWLKYKAQQERT